jgi:hypothetical protein
MECGKLKADGSPIFYFIVDPTSPDDPDAASVRHFFVTSHVDSYIEAFYYVVRRLSASVDSLHGALQRWHSLYTRVFGTVSLENFKRNVESLPAEHFAMDTSEAAARGRAQAAEHSTSMRSGVEFRDAVGGLHSASPVASRRQPYAQNDYSATVGASVNRNAEGYGDASGAQPQRQDDRGSRQRDRAAYEATAAAYPADDRSQRRTQNHPSSDDYNSYPAATGRRDVEDRRATRRAADDRRYDSTTDDERPVRRYASARRDNPNRSPPRSPPRREDEARRRVDETRLRAAALPKRSSPPRATSPNRQSNLKVHPVTVPLNETTLLTYPRDVDENAKIELHRIRAELTDTSNLLTIERSKAQVNTLSDAERAALLYKLEQARQDAAAERGRAKDSSDRLRTAVASLEDRLQALVDAHEATLRERSSAEYDRLKEVESQFLQREADFQREFEGAVHERERKLNKAVSRVKTFEVHLQDALDRIEQQKTRQQETTTALAAVTNERASFEEENRRLQRQVHAMEMQLEDAARGAELAEAAQRKAEHETAQVRLDVARARQEGERLSQFTATLHRELQQLDDSAITAAEMMRRKVLRQRTPLPTRAATPPMLAAAALQMKRSAAVSVSDDDDLVPRRY